VWCGLLCFDGRINVWSLIGGDIERGLEGSGEEDVEALELGLSPYFPPALPY